MKRFMTTLSTILVFSGAFVQQGTLFAEGSLHEMVSADNLSADADSSASVCGAKCGYQLCCLGTGAVIVGAVAAAIVASSQSNCDDTAAAAHTSVLPDR